MSIHFLQCIQQCIQNQEELANTHNIKLSYQSWRHFLYFTDQISKELCHILLFTSVQRLFVHGVCPAKGFRVVSLSFTCLALRKEWKSHKIAYVNPEKKTSSL